jgi:hypothetical protein
MRGYNLRHYATKRTGYHNSPTPHQLASYGSKILNLVKCNRVQEFGHMLECGLSPNACNAHGESLMHMICRHGKVDLFRVLLAYDVDLQQTDDYGRTPMHDACWASKPNFEIAKWLLEKDPALLFLFDARGSLPLTYVTKANWGMWNFFLEENMDHFFPRETAHLVSHRPPLCTVKPGTRPVPDPKDVIPASLANMVATGVMSPYELMMATQGMDSDDDTEASDSEDSDWDSDDDDSDDDDDDDSDSEPSSRGPVSHRSQPPFRIQKVCQRLWQTPNTHVIHFSSTISSRT